jgi:tripartite-type tricarboxylate transporter receptor subunit TctC
MHSILKHLYVGLSLTACLAGAHAQYPDKPITMLVPFPPGGTTDALARILAKNVAESLGKPIIVENKPGAEGQLAAQELSRATPDGYKIGLVTSGNMSALPAMRKNPPYDVIKDFTPIADIGRYAFFLFVHSSVPATNFKEFIAYAKANPGKMSYGTGNNTGVLTFAQVQRMVGIELLHVPYKGEPPATLDLVAGRLQAMIGTGAGLPYAKDGKLRTLVTLLPERSALAPDVPVLREIGMSDLPITPWAAIVGPAGLPKEVVERLNKELVAAAGKHDVKAQIEQLGFGVTPGRPETLANLIKDQLAAHRKLVEAIGLPLQ